MPKFLEDRLEAAAEAKGKTGKEADRYVYGTLNNMGAMHGSKETAKGKAMDAKHAADMKKKMQGRGKGKGKGKPASAPDPDGDDDAMMESPYEDATEEVSDSDEEAAKGKPKLPPSRKGARRLMPEKHQDEMKKTMMGRYH